MSSDVQETPEDRMSQEEVVQDEVVQEMDERNGDTPPEGQEEEEEEKKEEKLGFKQGFKSLWLLVSTSFKAAPGLSIAGLILVPLGQLSTQLTGLLLKFLADAAIEGRMRFGITIATLMALTGGGFWFTIIAGARIRLSLSDKVGFALDKRLTTLTAGLPGLEHHERPEYLDKIQLLKDQWWLLGSAMNSLVGTFSVLGQTAFTLFLLARLHPLLTLLPLAGIPTVAHQILTQRRMKKVEEETAETNRLSEHMYQISTSTAESKELRVFNLEDEVKRKHREAWQFGFRKIMHARKVIAIRGVIAWIIPMAAISVAVGFVALLAIRGDRDTTPGDVILAVVLSGQINNSLYGLLQILGWVLQVLRAAGRLVWLIDYSESTMKSVPEPAQPPERIQKGIRFDNVSFKYPGTEEYVLSDVNLFFPAGSVVALVGENGAGKTSLIKLVTRFYDPTDGQIFVDDTDLTRIPHEEWRLRMAAGFQDFAKFELLAKETVGVGDLPSISDDQAVLQALDRAGASDVVGKMEGGLAAQLGRQWDQGVELSVGQWQKLALGRALMRDMPLLLVLDEPTSALDSETEHALFEKFAAATRTRRDRGSVTILVSHRFSTVRMADLIVVIDKGKVVEAGSHEQLMQRGGLYAELYLLQAKAYR